MKSDIEDRDPWDLPDFVTHLTPWRDLTSVEKVSRVLIIIGKFILLLALLYLFIISLDLLGSAFQLLGGRKAGNLFMNSKVLQNPISGLMIGVLVTVVMQSSSTTTSIMITMTGSGLLNVDLAIYMVMGTNIGTTVTNTIVSLGHSGDRDSFRRAFAGATVHDMFNWLAVCVLLPLEVITGMFRRMSFAIVDSLQLEAKEDANIDILKVITKPFAKLIVQTDKEIIQKFFTNQSVAWNESVLVRYCEDATNESNKKIKCPSLFSYWPEGVSDTVVGVVLLVLAILILCICLICIIQLLHNMLKGMVANAIKKLVNGDFPGCLRHLTGYVAILVGVVLTIILQSSSVFTSAMIPLVGVGVISVERMYPLTLGSNIGTTITGILAALVLSGVGLRNGLQLALCHLLFNIFGIILFYPIPFTRVPVKLAKKLGNKAAKYRWLSIVYMIVLFVILPLLVFVLSLPGWYVLLGIGGPCLVLFIIIVITNILQARRKDWLPRKLQNWEFLPVCCHSLEPYDKVFHMCRDLHRKRRRKRELEDAAQTQLEQTMQPNYHHVSDVETQNNSKQFENNRSLEFRYGRTAPSHDSTAFDQV